MAEQSNYLSDTHSDFYEKKHQRYKVRHEARIITIGRGLSGLFERRARLTDISVAGAGLEVGHFIGLPSHYYLMIEGIPNRIGCAEIYRQGSNVGVKFLAQIDEGLVHKLVRADYFEKR